MPISPPMSILHIQLQFKNMPPPTVTHIYPVATNPLASKDLLLLTTEIQFNLNSRSIVTKLCM